MPGDFDQEALLAFVSELTKRVEDLKKEVASIGAQAGTGMQKLGEETERFGRTLDRDAKSLKGMREQGSGLVGMMRGAAGLGVAFYGAGQAMENFARNELVMRNFATDVGLTTSEVNKLKTQLSASGIDGGVANQQLSSLASKLDSIRVYQTASPVYKAIAANDPLLAKQLLDAEKIGNRMKSMDAIRERWNTGPRSKLYITEQLGVTQSTMEALERGQRKDLVQPTEFSDEELQKYNDQWHNVTQTVINLLGATAMTMASQTNQFMENTKKEFSGIASWLGGLKKDFEGKGEPGKQIFGPKGVLPNKQEFESLFGPKGYLPDKKEMEDAWKGIKNLFSTEAHAAEPTGADTLLEGADSFAYRFGDWEKQKLDVQKDSNQLLEDIRDLLQSESASGGPMGVGGAGYGGSADGGGAADAGPGGQARVRDEAGNPIDQETMKLAEGLGRAGDTAGLQKLFASRGYRMSGAACGIVASKYARAAGFEPPKSGAIATSWHRWGEQSSAEDVNAPDRPFGSIMGTYYHRRYGGNPNEILKPGQTGGHVMTIVPGSYDPKTGTVGVVDQYGFKRRSIKDIDFRYAGDQAVKEAERIRKGEGQADPEASRRKIDSSFPGMRTGADKARVDVEFNGVPKGVTTDAELLEQGVFNTLNIKKSQQQPQPN